MWLQVLVVLALSPSSEADLTTMQQTFEGLGCSTGCEECSQWEHKMSLTAPLPNSPSAPHGCMFGESCEHSVCFAMLDNPDPRIADIERFRVAVLDSNHEVMRTVMRDNPDRIRYNAARDGYQVVGCDKQVVLHLPAWLVEDRLTAVAAAP